MRPGDFIITPSWTWHDHGHPGDEPVVWMDGLDNRIVHMLAASESCVSVSAGATASSGFVDRLFLAVLSNSANALVLGHANGAWGLSAAAFKFGRDINVSNLAGERAAEVTVVSA